MKFLIPSIIIYLVKESVTWDFFGYLILWNLFSVYDHFNIGLCCLLLVLIYAVTNYGTGKNLQMRLSWRISFESTCYTFKATDRSASAASDHLSLVLSNGRKKCFQEESPHSLVLAGTFLVLQLTWALHSRASPTRWYTRGALLTKCNSYPIQHTLLPLHTSTLR